MWAPRSSISSVRLDVGRVCETQSERRADEALLKYCNRNNVLAVVNTTLAIMTSFATLMKISFSSCSLFFALDFSEVSIKFQRSNII